MRRILLLSTVALVVAALTGGQVGAATYNVSTNADSGAGSLRAAINKANANSGPDTITFAPFLSGRTIKLASRLPTVTDGGGLTINGGTTNIAVSGEDKVRVFEVASGAKLTLVGLTVANGLAPDDCADFPVCPAPPGGGILNFGTLALRGSTISDNSAGIGGAISNEGGTLTVSNSTFSGNGAPLGGGGILNRFGTLTVRHSALSGNVASGEGPGFGAGFGGGILSYGALKVQRSILSENGGKTGGGIFLGGGATLTVTGSTLSGNSGSGIFNDNGTVRVRRSTLSGNSVGIHNGATLRVNNSTLSGNGSGILNGDILTGGFATLRNTIVANSSQDVDCRGPITDYGHSLDSDGSCVNAINSLSGVDPKLGPLADNGGPTPTHALLAGSPALGRGFSSKAKTDQRGEERPSHAGCSDIGAFEEQDPQMQPPFLVKDDFYKPLEDTELRSDVLSNDCDSNEKPASVVPGSQGTTHGTLTRNADGSFVYNPDTDFFGVDPFTYTVPGGEGAPSVGTVEIDVIPVNDAPSFKKGADQSANQGLDLQSVPGWATDISPGPANESDQSVHFISFIEDTDLKLFAPYGGQPNGGLPLVHPDGTLTYKPAADASGTATVSVWIKDDGGTANGGVDESAPQNFEVTVNPVNDTIP